MKAIITKFHGATDTKGARISARAEGCPTRFYSYDYDGNEHLKAAKAYRDERGWTGAMVGGGLPDKTGYAWCFVSGFPDCQMA